MILLAVNKTVTACIVVDMAACMNTAFGASTAPEGRTYSDLSAVS